MSCARAAGLLGGKRDHTDEVEALVTKKHLRRQRKAAKAGEAPTEAEPQGELELDDEMYAEDVRS